MGKNLRQSRHTSINIEQRPDQPGRLGWLQIRLRVCFSLINLRTCKQQHESCGHEHDPQSVAPAAWMNSLFLDEEHGCASKAPDNQDTCVSACVRIQQVIVWVSHREVNLPEPVIPKSSVSLRGIKVCLQRMTPSHQSQREQKLVEAGRQIDRLGGGEREEEGRRMS